MNNKIIVDNCLYQYFLYSKNTILLKNKFKRRLNGGEIWIWANILDFYKKFFVQKIVHEKFIFYF